MVGTPQLALIGDTSADYARQVVSTQVVLGNNVNTLLSQIVCGRSSPKEVGL